MCTQDLLLSPTQFGIPNSRLRYYLLAKQRPLSFCFETIQQVSTVLWFALDCHYIVLQMVFSVKDLALLVGCWEIPLQQSLYVHFFLVLQYILAWTAIIWFTLHRSLCRSLSYGELWGKSRVLYTMRSKDLYNNWELQNLCYLSPQKRRDIRWWNLACRRVTMLSYIWAGSFVDGGHRWKEN